MQHLGSVPLLTPVSENAAEALASYNQGEIITIRYLPVQTRNYQSVESGKFLSRMRVNLARRLLKLDVDIGSYSIVSTPHGAAVLSQQCDIIQTDRLTVQVAPIVPLTGGIAAEALIRRRPRFVPLPNAGDNLFVDLEIISTLHKNELVDLDHRPGVNSLAEARKFAQAIGRRFTRFPFPDELHTWLRSLEELLQSKASRPLTPEGVALSSVEEIRIEADNGWEGGAPYNLTILVIVSHGTLSYATGEDVPSQPDALGRWLRNSNGDLSKSAGEIAARLQRASASEERYYLWLALGEAWANRCRPSAAASDAERRAVNSVDGEVVSAEDLTIDRWWRSEALDLDHLSAPRPS